MIEIETWAGRHELGETVLDALKRARVFDIEKTDDGRFVLEECCDSAFAATLTREQLLRLADEIRTMAADDDSLCQGGEAQAAAEWRDFRAWWDDWYGCDDERRSMAWTAWMTAAKRARTGQ